MNNNRDSGVIDQNVNHPVHYQSETGLEVIDVIEAFCKNLNGAEAFCIANAIKYLCRFDKKNGVEDLKKAQWYINYVIDARTPADYVEPKNEDKKSHSLKKLLNSIYGISMFGVYDKMTNFSNSLEDLSKSFSTGVPYHRLSTPILYSINFETESDAYLAIKELDDFAKKNGHITIADVYNVLNLRIKDGVCCKTRGWRDTTGFEVKRNRHGWTIVGPDTIAIPSSMNVMASYSTTDVRNTYAFYTAMCKQILDTYIIASAETYEAFEVFATAIKNHSVERPVTANDADKIAKTFGVSLRIPTDLSKAGILWTTQDDWYVEDEYHHEDGSVSFSLRAPLWYQHKILEFRNNHHIAFDQAMDTYRESANDIKED